MQNKKIQQNSIALMLVIIFSKLAGMTRDVVLANYYGTSNISDAYLIAASVPTLLFYFIGHSLATSYLPVYNQVKSEQGLTEAQKFSNNILTISLLICAVLVLCIGFFPTALVRLFATGFDSETTHITSTLIRISATSLFFMTIVSIFTGFLHSKAMFLAPAAVSIPRNFAIVVSVVIAYYTNFKVLGAGLLLAYIFEFLFLLPFVKKQGYKYRITLDYKSPYVKQTLNMVLPILFSVAVSQINKVIDRSIASTVIEGGISALSYASIINSAVSEIIVTGILSILFASCSKWVAEGKHQKVKEELSNTINNIIFFLTPAMVGVILLAAPIVQTIFSRGKFDETSLRLTAISLCGYTVGMLPMAIRDTLVKVFYAYKDTKTTTIVSTISIVINIVLNLILYRFWGVFGLALATSISITVNAITLYIILKRKISDFGFKSSINVFLKSIFSSALMGIVVVYLMKIFSARIANSFLGLIISVFCGVLCYMLISLCVKNKPIMDVIKKIKKQKTI